MVLVRDVSLAEAEELLERCPLEAQERSLTGAAQVSLL